MRNKTISLNICIDVREVFNAKVEKEGKNTFDQPEHISVAILQPEPGVDHSHLEQFILMMFLQVVRETVWSSLDSSPGPGTDLLTLAKTSNLTDLQVIRCFL